MDTIQLTTFLHIPKDGNKKIYLKYERKKKRHQITTLGLNVLRCFYTGLQNVSAFCSIEVWEWFFTMFAISSDAAQSMWINLNQNLRMYNITQCFIKRHYGGKWSTSEGGKLDCDDCIPLSKLFAVSLSWKNDFDH